MFQKQKESSLHDDNCTGNMLLANYMLITVKNKGIYVAVENSEIHLHKVDQKTSSWLVILYQLGEKPEIHQDS